MTVEQKRREVFEAALNRDWAAHLIVLDRDGDGYVFGDINSAWWAFNAALDAVEIELPKRIVDWSTDSWGDGFNVSRDRCKEAIESTGLGIKVKS